MLHLFAVPLVRTLQTWGESLLMSVYRVVDEYTTHQQCVLQYHYINKGKYMSIKLILYKGDIPAPVEVTGSGWDAVIHFPQSDPELKFVTGDAGPTWNDLNSMNDMHYVIARAFDQHGEDAEALLEWTLQFINDFGHPYFMSVFKTGDYRSQIPMSYWVQDMKTIRDWTKLAQTVKGREWLLTGDAETGIGPVSRRFNEHVSAVVVQPRGGGNPSLPKKESKSVKVDVAMFPRSIIGWCSALITKDAENVIRYSKCQNNKKNGNLEPCEHVVPNRSPVGNKSGIKFCSARCKRSVEVRRRTK